VQQAKAASEGGQGYDVVLASGCTYSGPLLAPFFETVAALLAPAGVGMVVHLPLYTPEGKKIHNPTSNRAVRRGGKAIGGYWKGSRRMGQVSEDEIAAAALQAGLSITFKHPPPPLSSCPRPSASEGPAGLPHPRGWGWTGAEEEGGAETETTVIWLEHLGGGAIDDPDGEQRGVDAVA